MWTSTTRRQHSRNSLRYEIDTTDEEWAILAPFMPSPPLMGRPFKWEMREIVNAIFYVLRGGIPWRLLPREFPLKITVFHWFCVFRDTCLFERVNHALVIADRGDYPEFCARSLFASCADEALSEQNGELRLRRGGSELLRSIHSEHADTPQLSRHGRNHLP